MRKLSSLLLLPLVALAALLSSCGIDNPVEPLGPSLALMPGVNAVTDTATVAPGDTFLVQINASKGDGSLNRIEVREDGIALAASRIIFDGFPAQNNPNPVTSTDQLEWDIEIAANDAEGTFEYTIIITDENGNTASSSVDITTVEPTTPATTREMIMLLNQAGPAGQGGLDIDGGIGTGTKDSTGTDSIADIRDMGININLPSDQNWRQQIAPTNATRGVVLKSAASGVVWEDIQTLEDIAAAFEQGTEIAGPQAPSDVVQVGDIFLVRSGRGILYALVVTQVNVTAADNGDNYHFDVKGP